MQLTSLEHKYYQWFWVFTFYLQLKLHWKEFICNLKSSVAPHQFSENSSFWSTESRYAKQILFTVGLTHFLHHDVLYLKQYMLILFVATKHPVLNMCGVEGGSSQHWFHLAFNLTTVVRCFAPNVFPPWMFSPSSFRPELEVALLGMLCRESLSSIYNKTLSINIFVFALKMFYVLFHAFL